MPIVNMGNALTLASECFHIFPLRYDPYFPKNNKLPAYKGGYKIASRDEVVIRKWWREDRFNIGVSTEKYGQNEALIVVDVDVREVNKAMRRSLP